LLAVTNTSRQAVFSVPDTDKANVGAFGNPGSPPGSEADPVLVVVPVGTCGVAVTPFGARPELAAGSAAASAW